LSAPKTASTFGRSRASVPKVFAARLDAAINPGNSGARSLTWPDEVVGINTAIHYWSRGYEGVGFALPSTTAINNVYNNLYPGTPVTRGSIGVSFQEDLGTIRLP